MDSSSQRFSFGTFRAESICARSTWALLWRDECVFLSLGSVRPLTRRASFAQRDNWEQISRFFATHHLDVPAELTDAVLHAKPNAIGPFIAALYEQLTRLRRLERDPAAATSTADAHRTAASLSLTAEAVALMDFTDSAYQRTLPAYARSTMAHSLRTNIPDGELVVHPSDLEREALVDSVKQRFQQERQHQRQVESPERFDPSKSPRRLAGADASGVELYSEATGRSRRSLAASIVNASSLGGDTLGSLASVHHGGADLGRLRIEEIDVRQSNHRQVAPPVDLFAGAAQWVRFGRCGSVLEHASHGQWYTVDYAHSISSVVGAVLSDGSPRIPCRCRC
jgi:hypothetical protein